MRCVHIQIRGTDGKTHATTIQASSLYDGASQAMERWSRLWWFDPTTILIVRSGDESWNVQQDAVRRWAERRQS